MSTSAPWFALSSDWSDSQMFDDSAMGVRLAWVELLAWTKAHGRAGRVQLRVKKFAETKRLNEASVEEMLTRAVGGKAIIRQGDVVIVCNWKSYQDPKVRSAGSPKHNSDNDLSENGSDFSKSAATEHRAPSTEHQPPTTPSSDGKRSADQVDVSEDLLRTFTDLRSWFDQESRRRGGWLNGSESDWQNVQAAAARSLSAKGIRSRIGLFKWFCKGRHWDRLTDSDDDLARASRITVKRAEEVR